MKASEGQPIVLRQARVFARVLEEMTLHVEHGELTVGNQASRPRATPAFPEYSVE